jgi:hypothetical protein
VDMEVNACLRDEDLKDMVHDISIVERIQSFGAGPS